MNASNKNKPYKTPQSVKTQSMKRYILIFLMLIIFAVSATLLLISCDKHATKTNYIRIHVRANSDSDEDQSVKLAVRDAVVQYLAPLSAGINSKAEMWELLKTKRGEIKKTADDTLTSCGYDYQSNVRLDQERFPTKTYGDLTLQEGMYDAVIIELGTGKGKNWWCVAYPPLCFIASEQTGKEEVEYRSWIAKLLSK